MLEKATYKRASLSVSRRQWPRKKFYKIASRLTKSGIDKSCEPCQRFYREGLLISFTKIMTDEAVSSWRYDIQVPWMFNLC